MNRKMDLEIRLKMRAEVRNAAETGVIFTVHTGKTSENRQEKRVEIENS